MRESPRQGLRALQHAAAVVALLAPALVPQPASAQSSRECLYNDAHVHVQDFKAQGVPIPEGLQMMHGHVCRNRHPNVTIIDDQGQVANADVSWIGAKGVPSSFM